jgi:hypothetical protein
MVIAGLLLVLIIYFAMIAIDRPPEITDLSSLQLEKKQYANGVSFYGNNWLRHSESGLWEMYLEGEPFERGVAFGRLTRELLYYQETSFVEQIRKLVPSESYLKVLKYFVAFFDRNLDKNIPLEYQEEIYGTSLSCSPEFDFIGSGYQRQLNYHAAHDIGHALQGLNLVACTSFSVWDDRSSDSSLLVGRNFDFYMGDKFAENKIVCFVKPEKGNKFMMITWPDMIGVVSGMNEKGLTVTINAAKSSIPLQAATPVTILAREILQYAGTIGEAYEISKKRNLFVSESIMIGSARDGKTAIIEKSPDAYDMVQSDSSYIICTNHYQGDRFKTDKRNISNIEGSDSYARYQRVDELVNRYGRFDVQMMADILRDQKSLGDTNAGMGNQLVINQLIAHHSVVFNPGSLRVWISTSPWQLGKYVSYDLNKVFGLSSEAVASGEEIADANLTIAADTFINTAEFKKFERYRNMTSILKKHGNDETLLPEGFPDAYVQTNPELYQTYMNLGAYFEGQEAYDQALTYYLEALRHKLPGKDEERKIRKIVLDLQKKVQP